VLKKIKNSIKLLMNNNKKLKPFLYVRPFTRVQYFIAQRIFRINSSIPWPVHWSSIVTHPKNITQDGFRPYFGFMPGQYIQAKNGIIVGENLRLGPGVKIISASHELNDYSKHTINRPIKIGRNCWLAANVIILPGIELGDHVVVAAGAVVTKSFGPNLVIGGNPAKVIRDLPKYQGDPMQW
jgi:acetyltransferase-like isoleucine patch superfamily enzyme